MKGRTSAVVLIGESTAARKWIKYEIVESWKQGLGLLGIHIHNITDQANQQANKGRIRLRSSTLTASPSPQL